MTPFHRRLGATIKTRREQILLIPQRELALRLGLSQNMLARLELGKCDLSVSTLLAIALHMQINLPGLFRESDYSLSDDPYLEATLAAYMKTGPTPDPADPADPAALPDATDDAPYDADFEAAANAALNQTLPD